MNTPQQPVRLTERQRTILEMLSHGSSLSEIVIELHISSDYLFWSLEGAADLLGSKNNVHSIALAIRGGHIL